MKPYVTHRGALALLVSLACCPGAFAESAVEWSYEGETGPRYWSRLTWDYAICEQGVHQSPIDGRVFPLEAHFVMGNEAGQLAVMSYLFEEGEANEEYAPIVAGLPQNAGEKRKLEGLDFDLEALKPLSGDFFMYPGSLTTPPCSEGVVWMVRAEPEEMSAEQLAAFARILDNNARPVQPRHIRRLLLVKAEQP